MRHAEIWYDKILHAPRVLERFPEIGALVEEIESVSLRELLVGDYRIVYRHLDDVCRILLVAHGSRDLKRLLDPENLP